MTKLVQSVLRQIKKEARHPLARWRFVLKRGAIWFLVILSVLLAAVFFGSLLADFIATKWELASRWPGRGFGLLWDTVKGFWIFGAVIALIGSVIFFRLTRRGYRYSVALITIVLAITSVVTGFLLLPTPLPHSMRDWHEAVLPPMLEGTRFNAPEEGRLLGEITAVEGDTAYLQTIDGQDWELWLFDNQPLAQDDLVEVFGEEIDDSTFAVLNIVPVPPNMHLQ